MGDTVYELSKCWFLHILIFLPTTTKPLKRSDKSKMLTYVTLVYCQSSGVMLETESACVVDLGIATSTTLPRWTNSIRTYR